MMRPEMSDDRLIKQINSALSDQIMSSCAGAVLTSLFVTPFDVVKTRLQVQARFQNSDKICSVYETCVQETPKFSKNIIDCCGVYKEPFKGTLDALVKISKIEGVKTLWSGLVPTLFISVPSTVIYFTMYDQLRELFSSHLVPPMGPVSVPLFSGITARVLTGTVVSPIEFFRTKIQSEQVKYSDAFKNVSKLVKHKGYLSLWHGWVPTTLRDVPFSAIYWTIYEQLKLLKGDPSAVEFFVFGAVSGSIAAILTLPFDVIKTQRQAELGENRIITRVTEPSVLSLLVDLYRRGGMKSLFAGMMPRVLKIAPACAIMISSYEVGKVYFSERRSKMFKNEDLV
ncbi:Solute carrier family 25 member 39 like protein [Argiope bruennichi]|uniref:Solute carrier family 25 member 39 like protein n=1 Tax=Argiope bruennichi TaxID=94029 RepID=A0A8T0FLQ3_ARGBR|nr:Solute carrier family 25 member 39 like protein [Argiope bruennichi]